MSTVKSKFFSNLQKIGQSLMVPVSVLPAAGLLVAVGRTLQEWAKGPVDPVTKAATFIHPWAHAVGDVFFKGGIAIFEQLPVVFAVGVAIGFTGGAGIAGLAAVVGYFTLTNVIDVLGALRSIPMKINTGVFGGILVGFISANLYKKYYQTKLHPVFGFFSGKRLVPIVTVAVAMFTGLVLAYVWPPIQSEIRHFGEYVMGSDLGPAFYAAGKRLLIPLGLHHVYYPPFLYEFGQFVQADGKVILGESARYYAGDASAGRFMASEFPIMLFGLPAATLAMYFTAKTTRRKAIAGVMLSAALTSIITGITEPIEFAFIFVAPLLFGFHVLAAFCSGLLTNAFGIQLGYTFSASLIDYFLGLFNAKNSMYLWTVVGPVVGLVYFTVFYFGIKWFNLKTPGREEGDDVESADGTVKSSEKALGVLEALGGAANIKHLDACITRLRVTVVDNTKVLLARFKTLGASGVLDAGGGNLQIVFGVESDQLKEEINALIQGKHLASPSDSPQKQVSVGDKVSKTKLYAPMKGRLLELKDVPDATFADKILGDGFAIDPSEGVVYSPCNGEVLQVFRTQHALGLKSDDGAEILIHVGIDTVKMNGQGFKSLVKAGDRVKTGQALLEFDLELVKNQAKSTISPIVITNTANYKSMDLVKSGPVQTGDNVLLLGVT